MSNHFTRQTLLQEGVSCAIATLTAIMDADLLESLPEAAEDKEKRNNALWLLNMLADHLGWLQARVDAVGTEEGEQ